MAAFRRDKFSAGRLEVVARALSFGHPSLIGDQCRLNSGGPAGLAVEFPTPTTVVVAWATHEAELPRVCFYRCPSPHETN